MERYAPCHRALRLVHSLVAMLDEGIAEGFGPKIARTIILLDVKHLEDEARELCSRIQTTNGVGPGHKVPQAVVEVLAAYESRDEAPIMLHDHESFCMWCGALHDGPTDDPICGVDR
jgi:hypothetical protein